MIWQIIKFIVRSNLWVSVCFAAFIFQSNILLQVEDMNLVWFCFFSTLFTYNAQRIYKFKKSTIRSPFNTWIEENIKLLMVFAAIGFVGMGSTFLRLKEIDLIILFFPFLFSIFYVVPLPGKKKNLRELPFLKIFIIAVSWTVIAVFLPLHRSTIEMSFVPMALFTLEKFLFILAITIPFDIRDVHYDPPNIKTLPQILGLKKAYSLSYLILSFSFLFFIIQYFLGQGGFLTGTIFIYLLSAFLIFKSKTTNNEDFHGFYLDGIFLFQTLALIIGMYLSIASL